MTDSLTQGVDTKDMKVRPLSLRIIVLALMVVLPGSVIGCAGTVPVGPVAPAAAKPIEDARANAPALVPPPPLPAPTDPPPSAPTSTFTPQPSPTPIPTATPTFTPSPTPRPGLPVRLEIPAIGVDAYIEPVGLTKDLAMDVPSRVEDVAWYRLGYRPGERGHAVIAGHLDTVTGAPAVFWDLESLEPGDEIVVQGLDGVQRRFIVDFRTRYPYDDAPVQQIFGPANEPQLVLITCKGTWDRIDRNYSHRVVVYAKAVQDDDQ